MKAKALTRAVYGLMTVVILGAFSQLLSVAPGFSYALTILSAFSLAAIALYAIKRMTIDPLTKMNNRMSLESVTQDLIRRGQGFSILFVDLDRFGEINKRHGHRAGDHALQSVAESIRRSIRPTDHSFRYGGDEFVVILPTSDPAAASTVKARIQLLIARRGLSASIGIASAPKDGANIAALIAVADLNMHAEKADHHTGD